MVYDKGVKMKKIIPILIAASLLLCSCLNAPDNTPQPTTEAAGSQSKSQNMKAIWISCYDYNFSAMMPEQITAQTDLMLDNISAAGFNTVFLHVRANADAIYPSQYFPLSGQVPSDKSIDLLKLFIESAHKRSLELHAWINPYRISGTSGDVNSLIDGHIAKKWATDPDSADRVISYKDALYFNPSSSSVQQLVIAGIKEIIENYDVDGIHLDDYFYPVSDEDFDKADYDSYIAASAKPLTLTEWRKANISALVSSVYKICSANDILFGVSPTAHLCEDYLSKNGYADVEKWLASGSYADYIIPQIYWGFEYPDKNYCFDKLTDRWAKLDRSAKTQLYVGLAAYKIGTEDCGDEWQTNDDIIKRQVEYLYEKGISGFSVFSYSSFFSDQSANTRERMNLLEFLRSEK